MVDIVATSSWLPFWDWLLIIAAFIALLGLVGTYSIEYFKKELGSWVPLIKDVSAAMVIAGAGGQIVATYKVASINSEIVAFLNDRAAAANKSAAEAHERAATLEWNVENLKGQNLLLQAKNLDLEKNIRGRQISDEQRSFIAANLRGWRASVIIIKTDTAEAGLYADRLADAFKSVRIPVHVEVLAGSSPLFGVIVCETNNIDVKIFDVLRRAQIATRFVRLKEERPEFCDKPGIEAPIEKLVETLSLGLIKPGTSSPRLIERGTATSAEGTRVFVGQRPAIR